MAKQQARPQVRFDELAVFVEVAAAGSLAGAARRLGLPKSTIGRAVARVERDYGVALVRRMARGQALTESGRRLANLASSHIAALRDLASALASDAAEPYGILPDYGVTGTTAYLVHAPAHPLPTTLQMFRSFLLERGPRLLMQA